MGTKRKRRMLAAVLLSAIFLLTGPMRIDVYANLDPNVLNGSGSSSQASAPDDDDDSDDNSAQVYQAQTPKSSSSSNKYQAQIDEISVELKNLEAQKAKIQADINATKSAKEKVLVKKQGLDQEISITSNEIGLLLDRIALLKQDIQDKEQQILEKQADIDHSYQTFKTRLRVMQLNDDSSTLGLLLGVDSFSDFLTRTQTISRIAESDQELMDNLTQQRVDLEAAKQQLQETHTQVQTDKEEMENRKYTLGVQLSETKDAIQDMEKMEKEFLADLAKNKAAQAAMQKELDDIYARMKYDENPYVGGEMLWPVPGAYKITSQYGWRFNGSDYHTGIDITYNGGGTYGASIVAANDGTVSFVNWKYTPGRGYGIYLIIDHGGKVSTLYGHCSNIVVNYGDKVKRGQKIAEVGSTGWSTGPHLHFEVRENGVHKPPLNYLTKK